MEHKILGDRKKKGLYQAAKQRSIDFSRKVELEEMKPKLAKKPTKKPKKNKMPEDWKYRKDRVGDYATKDLELVLHTIEKPRPSFFSYGSLYESIKEDYSSDKDNFNMLINDLVEQGIIGKSHHLRRGNYRYKSNLKHLAECKTYLQRYSFKYYHLDIKGA
ncbi:hypothetical protein ACFLZZ_03650 [Nanoarchaeota archaeon]